MSRRHTALSLPFAVGVRIAEAAGSISEPSFTLTVRRLVPRPLFVSARSERFRIRGDRCGRATAGGFVVRTKARAKIRRPREPRGRSIAESEDPHLDEPGQSLAMVALVPFAKVTTSDLTSGGVTPLSSS